MASLIGDDLLMEILSRIPTPIQAIRCKLVCKRWFSLISNPYFISRFKQQHIKHQSRYPKPLLGLLAGRVFIMAADNGQFNFDGSKLLDYLPVNIDVVASCNDLILCEAADNLYLCNPFTRQWVALPPPPPRDFFTMGTGLLVCQPSDQFRYRIVRFYYRSRKFVRKVETYCSETSEWISQWIQCDDRGEEYRSDSKNIAAHNGKLHWVNRGGECLVTYDPFNKRLTSLRLLLPNRGRSNPRNSDYYHVGECEGVLRVMRLERRHPWPCGSRSSSDLDDGTVFFKDICVWELQEEDARRLMIFKDLIVFDDEAVYYGGYELDHIYQMAFHPRNKELLYLVIDGFLTAFHTTTTSELMVITKSYTQYVFALQLPWWPTSILNPSPTS